MSTAVTKSSTNTHNARQQEFLRPYYEVTGDRDTYQVHVYLPGVAKDGATITLEKDNLLVEASRRPHWQEGWRPVHREIPAADFRLRLQLNMSVDEERISATSRDGVLTISLPVAEEAKPRTIAIE